jgi:hypothetical protein
VGDVVALEALEQRRFDLGPVRDGGERNLLLFSVLAHPRAESRCHEDDDASCNTDSRCATTSPPGNGVVVS